MRLLLLIALGYLAWIGYRKLRAAMAARPPMQGPERRETVTDLSPCPGCGTYTDSRELVNGHCPNCRGA